MDYDQDNEKRFRDADGSCHPMTPMTPNSNGSGSPKIKTELPVSPGEYPHSDNSNHAMSLGMSHMSNYRTHGHDQLPISDNNVSTTNDALEAGDWDVPENEADLDIAVAAAIGVGGEFGESSFRTNNLANRMRNKLAPRVPNIPRRGQTAVMGEINRSNEKMSLGDGGMKADTKSRGMGGPGNTVMMPNNRRDSSWTVSTEGYGSMRSNTSASRRCSELSQMSSMSTARQNLQSPAWDPISPGSSRRSSEAGARMSPVMSHHLSKLHKKALAAGTTSSLAQSQSAMSVAGDLMTSYNDGRSSAMSEAMPGVQMEDGQGRRMSDPVRPLDRNFGVGGQMSRHRSFGNLQAGGERQPLHQQRVRGQEGGYSNQNGYMA